MCGDLHGGCLLSSQLIHVVLLGFGEQLAVMENMGFLEQHTTSSHVAGYLCF